MCHVKGGTILQVLASHSGDRTGQVHLFLRAVTDNDCLLKHRGIVIHEYPDGVFPGADPHLPCVIAKAGDLHVCVLVPDVQREASVLIGGCAGVRPCEDCSSDDRLVVGIEHNSRDPAGRHGLFVQHGDVHHVLLHLNSHGSRLKKLRDSRFHRHIAHFDGDFPRKVKPFRPHDERIAVISLQHTQGILDGRAFGAKRDIRVLRGQTSGRKRKGENRSEHSPHHPL